MDHAYKVAFVASIYEHFSAFHLPFMQWLQRWGCEVHAYARESEGKRALEEAGVVCHHIPFQRGPFHKDNVHSLRVLTERFKVEKFDFVHVHTPTAAIIGRIAARRAQIRSVLYTAHGFHFYKGASWHHWLLYYPIERFMARLTDTLITMNEEDYDRAKQFPVRDKVVYVPGVGVDVSYYQTGERSIARQQLGIDPDVFVIACVAELIPRKNQIQLIEAIKLMVERGDRIMCLFVGEGEKEQDLKQGVNRLGMARNTLFLGARRDIPDILHASDVGVLVSRQEGLPRALLEMMAAGKAIVATNIRGNRDLITDGENGFLVPVGDGDATARALQKLYDNRMLRRAFEIRNKENVDKYQLSKIVTIMSGIYISALRGDGVSANPHNLSETV